MTSAAGTTGTHRPTAAEAGLLLPTAAWVRIGVLGLAFVALFYRWIWTQAQHSYALPSDWGHAFVVPLISLYLIWQQRAELVRQPVSTFWPGILPILLGIVCYFIFLVPPLSNHMLQGFAMLLTLAGVALFTAGPRVFRYLFLPIAFLIFTVRVSDQIMTRVTFPLQLLASKGAHLILKLISAPGDWFFVDVSGNVLEIIYKGRSIPLNVAEACSGMRMVIAFIALAAAVAVLACRHWWQRVAVLLLSVPVALLMNTIRVAVLGLVSLIDPKLASGDAHMLIGTILLIPGLFLFLAVVRVLGRLVVETPERAAA